MEDGTITDVQVSSSSRLDDSHSPSQARLNFKEVENKAGDASTEQIEIVTHRFIPSKWDLSWKGEDFYGKQWGHNQHMMGLSHNNQEGNK